MCIKYDRYVKWVKTLPKKTKGKSTIQHWILPESIGGTDTKENIGTTTSPEIAIENQSSNKNILPIIKPLLITTSSDLESLSKKLTKFNHPQLPVAIDTETTNLNPFKAELVGVGLCWGEGPKDLAYIPLGHDYQGQLENQKTNRNR